MHDPLGLVVISSILGKSIKVSTPLTFECAFVTGGIRLFSVL